MPTPHLPVEIHNIISSHLSKEDLSTYRSASKALADIGAQYLFKDLVLHASYDSLNRIKNVGNHQDLKEAVHSIEWDTSSLNLDAYDFNDWKNRIRGLKRQDLAALQQALQKEQLDKDAIAERMHTFLWQEYERYESLLAEEKDMQNRHLWNLEHYVAHFPRLDNIIVRKRLYAPSESDNPLRNGKRSSGLVNRGMLSQHSRAPYIHSEDMFPFVVALGVAQTYTHHIEAKSLNFAVFNLGAYVKDLQNISVSNITRLKMRFAMADPSVDPLESSMSIMNCKRVLKQGNLMDFLRKFKTLQALDLDFDARSHGNGRAPVDLQDVFSEDHVWPLLQELKIRHADTSAFTFGTLISAHSTTLKDLALGDLCLEPAASWEALLMNIQPELTLEKSKFEYFLFDARLENYSKGRSAMVGWYCDSEECSEQSSDMSKKLEKFMLEGGICPLSEERKIARVVGKMGSHQVDDWVNQRHISLVS